MDGPGGHLELSRQLATGDAATGLEQQENREQAVGTHEKSLVDYCRRRIMTLDVIYGDSLLG